MGVMMTHRIFNLLDFISFGLPAIALSIVTGFVFNSAVSFEAKAMMLSMSMMFIAFYLFLIFSRVKIWNDLKRQYPTVLPYKIRVNKNSFQISDSELAAEIERVIELYAPFFADVRKLIRDDWTFISFEKGHLDHPQLQDKKIAGFVKVGGKFGQVSYLKHDQDIKETAFAHELGHVILGQGFGSWDNSTHHEFMKEHGLP